MSTPLPIVDLRTRMAAAVRDKAVVGAVKLATLRKVEARVASLAALPHAAEIRTRAAQIRAHVIARLPEYLEQFVTQVRARGGHVHFAPDAASAQQIIVGIAQARGLKLAVKGKSMTSEEVHLNAALEAAGVRVVETDLGEFIVQIDHDRPSHIITPIIHKTRQQVGAAMARELGCAYSDDPQELTRIARAYLRDIFRRCDLGITGVNFGVAETGTLCLVTNEGNGRMTVTRPRVHVALMGIEKVVPRLRDLPVFLKLLARSSTGQPMGSYTTLVTGPRRTGEVDGPDELHVVLLDNGRSAVRASPLSEVLRCVRCGSCLNACPVYRNVGGHAYESTYGGPIGAVLSPLLQESLHGELPRASSLCGACRVACPVDIDIPGLLVKLRARHQRHQPWGKRVVMKLWAWTLGSRWRFGLAQRAARAALSGDAGWVTKGPGPLGLWTQTRDLPAPAPRSFRAWWADQEQGHG